MKRFSFLLVVAMICGRVTGAWAAPQKTVMDNGLTVITSPMPASPMAAINVWVRTGSANEGRFMGSGITHFTEHMLFKGTAQRPAGRIPEEAKAMGGYINASTGYDHTTYILSVPAANLARAIDLLSDMVMHPAFDPVELEKEREVIVKEMHMLNDDPGRRLDDLLNQTVYHVHPYQFRIIGREDIFRALKREDLLEYHRALYTPNNMIISVAGGVTSAEVLKLVEEKFAAVPARAFPLHNVPQEPEQIAPRYAEISYPTDLTRLSMAYQGVALFDPDLYALDVLAMALGQGESSRLYLELYKKKRLVESISAGNYTPQDRGYFEVSCVLKDQSPEKAVAAVKAMIAAIKAKGLLPAELDKVKQQAVADNIYGRQTAEGMSAKVAADEGFTGQADFSDRYLDGIRAVTNADIRRVAARYLVDRRLSIAVVKPADAIKTDTLSAPMPQGEVLKTVLPNGLVLLLKEDHSLPIVALNSVFNGGMRQETAALNGLSALTGSVWSKGYAGRTSDQIRCEVESRGASLGSYAGRNSFVLDMFFLSGDMPFMFDLFEKLMTAPSFPEDEIRRDKEQMLTALDARKDNVLQTTARTLTEALFLTHPMRLDSLGTPQSLEKIKRADLISVFDRYVRPDNGVISVFGDIDSRKVLAELERRLGRLKSGKPVIPVVSEPAPEALRFRQLSMEKEQAAVMIGFRGPLITDQDRFALDVGVNILSSSLGGRLFKRVREELGKSYALSGAVSPGIDAGTVTFFTLTTPDGAARVRAIMEEEFAKISSEPVAAKELADAKTFLVSRAARDQQTMDAQGMTRAVDELLGLGYANIDAYARNIDAVSSDDVLKAAKRYLDIRHAVVVVTLPSAQKQGE